MHLQNARCWTSWWYCHSKRGRLCKHNAFLSSRDLTGCEKASTMVLHNFIYINVGVHPGGQWAMQRRGHRKLAKQSYVVGHCARLYCWCIFCDSRTRGWSHCWLETVLLHMLALSLRPSRSKHQVTKIVLRLMLTGIFYRFDTHTNKHHDRWAYLDMVVK